MRASAALGWTLTAFSQPKPFHGFMISLQHPQIPDTMGIFGTRLALGGGAQSHIRAKEREKSQGFVLLFGVLVEDLVHSYLSPQFPGAHVRYCIEKFPWMRSFSRNRASLIPTSAAGGAVQPGNNISKLIIQTGLKTTQTCRALWFFSIIYGFLFLLRLPLCLCSVPGTGNEPSPVWELLQGCPCPASPAGCCHLPRGLIRGQLAVVTSARRLRRHRGMHLSPNTSVLNNEVVTRGNYI